MSIPRIVGLVLLVVGIALFSVGMNSADSLADRLSDRFTGHYTDQTTWFIIGGLGAGVGGLALLIFGSGRRTG